MKRIITIIAIVVFVAALFFSSDTLKGRVQMM